MAVVPNTVSSGEISFAQMYFNKADLEDTALGVRSAGYPCENVAQVDKVLENGMELPVFRIHCGNATYQGTVMNGKIYFKPWTGNLIGQ